MARAICFAGEEVLGLAEVGRIALARCVWTAGVPAPIREPQGFEPWGGCRDELVGPLAVGGRQHAARRVQRDGGLVLMDLHPARLTGSSATACADGQQVGYGQRRRQ